MNEDVIPKYDRLMEEKENFDRFKDITEAIQEKQRLYLAYDYNQLKDRVEDTAGSHR